ncbi:hypothetical protein PBAL39_00435 [Pedobacter sp. BAL39]|nr:hypothetical protein PBAL39_00435 [Pedobacter sp. BAL39]
METKEQIIEESVHEIQDRLIPTNDHDSYSSAEDQQTVIVDPAITGETDELDPAFHQDPDIDPEDDEDDDDFPTGDDIEEDDYEPEVDDDLNFDDDELGLDDDDDELN